MAKSPTNVDSTGRPLRMCRKCPTPHPMKLCPRYKRPVATMGVDSPDNEAGPVAISSGQSSTCNVDTPGKITGELVPPGHEEIPDTSAERSPVHPTEDNSQEPPEEPSGTIPDSLIDPSLRDISNTDNEHPNPPNDDSQTVIAMSDSSELSTPSHSRSASLTPLRLLDSHELAFTSTPSTARSLTPSSSFSSPFSSPSKPARLRATKANPCFGEVVGVYRGSKLLTVRRTRHRREEKKKNTEEDNSGINIPKVFYDRTRRFMTKLEDLAEDTGAWVHFSAQHPTANEPFIHFTSKRLRTEGGELLDNLHQANHQLYTSLMSARRCDTSQLAAKLAQANKELARVNAEAEAKIAEAKQAAAVEVELKLAEANAAKLAAEKEFQRIRAALNLAGVVIPGLTTE
ncbi:hypothetical protein VNI00_008676 [Paramarasmius palmivorus]|uniref:Uncharacterized protein n=1 Tax=Paramarasmius palmivorus TaxID=297713 RepID=A0AAW0CVA1_9AGAR